MQITNIREEGIMLTLSNLIMSGAVIPKGPDVTFALEQITSLTDIEPAEIMCQSRLLYDHYLGTCWKLN